LLKFEHRLEKALLRGGRGAEEMMLGLDSSQEHSQQDDDECI